MTERPFATDDLCVARVRASACSRDQLVEWAQAVELAVPGIALARDVRFLHGPADGDDVLDIGMGGSVQALRNLGDKGHTTPQPRADDEPRPRSAPWTSRFFPRCSLAGLQAPP